MPTVRAILGATAADDYRLKSLVEAVAMSDVFRMNVAASADTKLSVVAPAADRTSQGGL
jgi:hypothetical protein